MFDSGFAGIAVAYWLIAFFALLFALTSRTPSRRVWGTAVVLVVFGAMPVRSAWQQYSASKRWKESLTLFDERCKAAGERISRTVADVDGIVWMKWRDEKRNDGDQFALDDPFGSDCGGELCIAELLHATEGVALDPEEAARHHGPYRFVETVHPETRERYRYTAAVMSTRKRSLEEIEQYKRNSGRDGPPDVYRFVLRKTLVQTFAARYGATWDDVSTREDREHWIAGGSSKIIDLRTNEVIGERIGYLIDRGQGSTAGSRTPWTWARSVGPTCPEPQRSRDFITKVLRPQ